MIQTPSIKFFKQNFLSAYTFYRDLSNQVLNDTFQYCDSSSSVFLVLTIVFCTLSVMLCILNLFLTILYQALIKKIYLFTRHITNTSLMCEISRVRVLRNLVEKRQFFHDYHRYRFNSQEKQYNLRKSHDLQTQGFDEYQSKNGENSVVKKKIDSRFRKRRLEVFQKERLESQAQIFGVLIIFSIILGFLIYFGISTTGFYSGFQSTFDILSHFSWVTSIPPILSNTGFYLYMDRIVYLDSFILTETEQKIMISILDQQLDATLHFLKIIQTVESDKNIIQAENQIAQMIQTIDVTNFCDGYQQICQGILNGVMKEGVIQPISKYYEIYKTFQDDKFETQVIENESFFSRALSLALRAIRDEINQVILEVSSVVSQRTLLIGLIFSVIFFFVLINYIAFGIAFESNRFHLAKKILFSIPHYTLLIEESFLKLIVTNRENLGINS